jgi:thiamine pyrophosphate-dependent acetolactate synthase large subunit-like protein
MANRKQPRLVGRRGFMSGVALAGAGSALAGGAAPDASAASEPQAEPGAAAASAQAPGTLAGRPGSDYMVDVIKSLGIEYIASNPGSSFRGLHESIITYGGNSAPEFITCLHEESSVAMAHGYAKVALKPMAFMAHGTVGLQHAAMAVYNAWCDRVPLIGILGNGVNATKRRPGVEWSHTAQDPVALVRDFVKWDDQPASLRHFGESLVRAWKITMTPPMEPVMIVADSDLQEEAMTGHESPGVPRLTLPTAPAGESGAVREAAKWLVGAELPVIVADRAARTPAGVALLVELAETLGAPVIDQGGRMNFPNTHELSLADRGGNLIRRADVILGLELTDYWGTVNEFFDNIDRDYGPRTRPGTRLIGIASTELYLKSNYQDFQRYAELDLAIAGDAEATLPSLIEACRALIDTRRQAAIDTRRAAMAKLRAEAQAAALENATLGWDASPISTARLSAEIWQAIKAEDWSLVSADAWLSGWPHRMWDFDAHYRFIGHAGGAGGRRARQPRAWAAVGQHPVRRRSHVRAGCDLDRRASPDPAAERDAQQPRLPPGSDAPAAHGEPASARH